MSQHDYLLDNNPGVTFRADINAALAAIATINSGSIEPGTLYPGMLWLDTSVAPDGALRQRNQANTAWVAPVGLIGEFRLTVITTSQIWTKPPGLRWLEVIVIGAGGGVPSCPLTAAAQGSACSGAGGGGLSRKFYNAANIAATVSITVGAAGAVTPSAGGPTIFIGQTGSGGSPGTVLAAGVQAPANGGAGGGASGGDLNIPGGAGGIAWRLLTATYSQTGHGGASPLTPGITEIVASTTTPGVAGNFPGGGARGPANGASQAAAAAGAVGGAGAILLREYY